MGFSLKTPILVLSVEVDLEAGSVLSQRGLVEALLMLHKAPSQTTLPASSKRNGAAAVAPCCACRAQHDAAAMPGKKCSRGSLRNGSLASEQARRLMAVFPVMARRVSVRATGGSHRAVRRARRPDLYGPRPPSVPSFTSFRPHPWVMRDRATMNKTAQRYRRGSSCRAACVSAWEWHDQNTS